MTHQNLALQLPADQVTSFTDPGQMEEALRRNGVYQPTRQLNAGAFHAELATRSAGSIDLFADHYSTDISIYLETPPGGVGILLPTRESGKFLAEGFDLADDKLLLFPDGVGSDMKCSGPSGSHGISITQSRFLEMLGVLCPTALPPEELNAVQVGQHQLTLLGNEVITLLGQPQAALDEERLANLLEHTVLLVGCASLEWRSEGLTNAGAWHKVAREARDFIEENYRNNVRMEDLCRATGVGVRTLQRAFRKYFGINITDYIKTVRLDATYRALTVSDPSTTTVAELGMQHGFKHLGRLSLEFRERFGKSPSMVLSRGTRSQPV